MMNCGRMVTEAQLKRFRFFETLPSAALKALARAAAEHSFDTGDLIVHQHDEANAVYILLSGSVEFLMTVEGVDDLLVGTTSDPGALIGWSVVRAPRRYTASVKCTQPCLALRISHSALNQVLVDDPDSGSRILRAIADALVDRLEDARELLGRLPKAGPRVKP